MNRKIVALSLLFFLLISCENNEINSCQFKLNELIGDTSIKVIIATQGDSLIEVKDKVKDSSFSEGVYTFDKKKNLRSYGFFTNDKEYLYSEEYDSKGNLLKAEGTPLVEFRLWKTQNDTILFNAFLFALNKKYEDLEIITSNHDTIRPNFLYKCNFYSNVKCFSFKLPISKNINHLVLYSKGIVVNTCNQNKEPFYDTTSFDGVKWK